MALNSGLLSQLILSQCASKGIVGTEMPNFSKAFAKGLIDSFKSMNQVITMDSGVMTTGTGKGKMSGLVPGALVSLTAGMMMGKRIAGTKMHDLVDAVCNATVQHFNTMNEVSTTHTTVALGSGVGKVTNLVPSAMEAKIMQEMLGQGYTGTMMQPMISAFSKAFCSNVMSTAIVNVAISGSPSPLIAGSPIPSAGSGMGKVT